MTSDQISNMLREAHEQWATTGRKSNFNYTYLRKNHSALASRIDRDKRGLPTLYAEAGINPLCHTSQISYGNNDQQRKQTFTKIIDYLIETLGIDQLNDNSMNRAQRIPIPDFLAPRGNFTECLKHNCPRIEISLQSIYAQGARLYGSWKQAITEIGLDYQEDILRKPPSRTREDYIDDFITYTERMRNAWSVDDLKKRHHKVYRGLFNSHKKSMFSKHIEDVLLCACVEASYTKESELHSIPDYVQQHIEPIREDLYKNRLQQTVWDGNQRSRRKNPRPNHDRIRDELYERFSQGRRITRRYLEHSNDRADRTLLSATRRVNGQDHNQTLNKFGFLEQNLAALYSELDDRYTIEFMYAEFQRLFAESIEFGENRLTREYCSEHEKDLENAAIRKYGSWEKTLRKFGLDPKVFSFTAKKRTKRGHAFEAFFGEMLERYGFQSVRERSALNDRAFIKGKFLQGCRHKIRCKPDFVFQNLIIDTKTGYAAKRQELQLERYISHTENVFVITLRGDKKEDETAHGNITFLNFSEFISSSKDILGVSFDTEENQLLTRTLRNADWDPFVTETDSI